LWPSLRSEERDHVSFSHGEFIAKSGDDVYSDGFDKPDVPRADGRSCGCTRGNTIIGSKTYTNAPFLFMSKDLDTLRAIQDHLLAVGIPEPTPKGIWLEPILV
jgi:hypothetical protein